jgi:DNA topoisomerase-1
MKLIIVESPTKARTLTRFLGSAYRIEASMGHVRDLPKSSLGVDVDHDFAPSYIIPRDKTKQVNELKDAANKADEVILATDPDREGEAIAFHIAEILNEMNEKNAKKKQKDTVSSPGTYRRIAFHEITESAIKEALEHPRTLDVQLVNAQQARRVLDRLVGYTLSPLLWKKLSKRWLSAGRVQSVAVRLIVEREREIQKFDAHEYWTIAGQFTAEGKDALTASLVSKDGIKYEKTLAFDLFDGKYTTTSSSIVNEQGAKLVIDDLRGATFTVNAVDKKEIKRNPGAPYTTSTLQQDAARKLYFSSKKTMQIAQKLYEEGYITYHRTDSVNLSEKFMSEARDYVTRSLGAEFVPATPRKFKTKSKVAQEAHEAIRPTVVERKADAIEEGDFNRDHLRLYDLIWKRAIASQMAEAIFDSTTIVIQNQTGYRFETSGSVIKFEGFLKVMGRDAEESVIPAVSVGQELALREATPTQHFTSPPPRYTEASLVKTLEEKGIGRPSTYAPIMSTIVDRQYVVKEEKKLIPTELGFAVTDFLVQYFPNILDLPFTAHMEDDLDAIANGEKQWVPVIAEFYKPFQESIKKTYDTAEKVKLAEEQIDEKCPSCGHDLVIRTGKFGKFVACTNFPECTYTRQYGEKVDIPCPKCGSDILVKKSKRGKKFYGCSNYPTCTFAAWKKEDIK